MPTNSYGVPAGQGDFPGFVAGDPDSGDFLATLFQDYIKRRDQNWAAGKPATGYYGDTGATGALNVGTFGSPAMKLGFSNLLQNLVTQGRSDPRVLQGQVRDVNRNAMGRRDEVTGVLADRGLKHSGVGRALGESIMEDAANRTSDLYAQDAQLAYGRNQQNLGLLKDLVIQPSVDYGAIGAGQYGADKAAQASQTGAKYGAWGTIIGGLLGL